LLSHCLRNELECCFGWVFCLTEFTAEKKKIVEGTRAGQGPQEKKRIRTLVVDDSFFMRTLISDMLNSDPEISVVDTARDGDAALDKTKTLRPDVVTLDYLMPGRNGLSTIKNIMNTRPTPIVMLSAYTEKGALTTLKCLEAGAVGFVSKPSSEVSLDIEKVRDELIEEVKKASRVNIRKVKSILARERIKLFMEPSAAIRDRVIVIGASTGGPQVLERILSELPYNLPASVLVVQHIPAEFTGPLAKRFDQMSEIVIKEAEDGDVMEPGRVYIAPGGFHMTVKREEMEGEVKAVIRLNRDPLVHGLRPSIDVTMKSVSEVYGRNAVGILLTGMGEDGVEGMRAIKGAEGKTIAQDEATSLIFGMPRRAIEEGSVDKVLPVFEVSQEIIRLL